MSSVLKTEALGIETVLVTGANGTIGNGVARAFVRAGYIVYGLIRDPSLSLTLSTSEIIPIIGSPDDLAFLSTLYAKNASKKFDVIVSTTEQILNYVPHFNNILSMLRSISETSTANGVKPLVLFTSGCKDYGTTARHGDPDLAPHTESSPLDFPVWAKDRATYSLTVLPDATNATNPNIFDAIVLRPTTIYGYHSSFYGPYFDIAAAAKEKGVLELPRGRENVVLHGTHVDDCGEAYLALAETYLFSPTGAVLVRNKCYNIASHRYETLLEIAESLVKEYSIPGGIKWVDDSKGGDGRGGSDFDVIDILTGYSQWVDSEQLRRDTGWGDRRMLFSDGVGVYRVAYEAAVEMGDGGVEKIRRFIGGKGARA